MPNLYLDHNVLGGIAGRPRWADADVELGRLVELGHRGVNFSMSAWHGYELAEAGEARHIREYCNVVETLRPKWASDPRTIKEDELQRFLAIVENGPQEASRPVRAFSATPAQMWATYGGPVFIGEGFSHYVDALIGDPRSRAAVTRAADASPDAIRVAREALHEGSWNAAQPIIDRDYFAGILRCGSDDLRVERLLADLKGVYRDCPSIAVEAELTTYRARSNFRPKRSHAADLQHALVGLAYSDAFVTDDKELHEHCRVVIKKLKLPVQLCTRVVDVIL